MDVGRETLGSLPLSSTATGAASRVYGQSGSANNRPLDGDTVFEIGSITKVFTALLFADMVLRGEVAPDDPAREISARQREDAGFRRRADHAARSRDLHIGPAADAVQFRAGGSEQSLHRLHGRAALRLPVEPQARFKPGKHYEYANLGFGLLGHILELRARQELRGARRLAHLRAARHGRHAHHAFAFDAAASGARPQHRSRAGRELGFPALAGAGALRSTANDLFKFLRMCLDPGDTPRRRRA